MDVTINDIPRLYTALAEWAACLIFLGVAPPRIKGIRRIGVCAGALLIQAGFLVLTANVAIYFWIPCMMTAFLLMAGLIFICCRGSWVVAMSYAILAFVTAEFTASLEWQITCFFWQKEGYCPIWIQVVLLLLVLGITDISIMRLLKTHISRENPMCIDWKDFLSEAIIGIAVFATSNLSFVSKHTPFSGQYGPEIANIRTLVDLGGIAMLYAHLIHCVELKVRQELEAVQNVLQNQYQQYKQSRESIELINYKYHDLKHQIEFLRREQDPQKRNAFLNQMEKEIKQYELQNKTGNSVLDTVLTGKSLYCDKHGITLTAVADGRLLDFMDTMDICSIFGNALDNAIECELKIPDKDKRLIHVTVSQQRNFVMVVVENYFEGSLEYEEGNLTTTKKDKDFHGYGIKSIKYTVNKYDGAVNIDTKDSWFKLTILIPIR